MPYNIVFKFLNWCVCVCVVGLSRLRKTNKDFPGISDHMHKHC